jgi:rhomboid family GlyGly-CTERM serine protease
MDPLTLSAEALREPWRLWACHLVHFGWEHALANALALVVPLLLMPKQDRARLLAFSLFAAPILSLLLLLDPDLGQYRGASGLACALWAWVGLRLACSREAPAIGLLLVGGLLLKLGTEVALGGAFLVHPDGWRALPAAHLWGTLMGLAGALPGFQRARCGLARGT